MEPKLELYHLLLLPLLTSLFLVLATSSSLSFDFYATSCPGAEFMVRNTVRSFSQTDPTIPGKLLRLLFHDCMVEGCDGSVLLQGNGTERSDPANRSLGGFSVVDAAKRVGGPTIQIPMGRRDGRLSSAPNVRPNMIDTSFPLDDMIHIFSSKGLSLDDLVVLSDKTYAAELAKQCPAGASDSVTVNNDPGTSVIFDNQYYQNLLAHKGLFQTDSVLFGDERTQKKVEEFANSQESFFQGWGSSFVKLTTTGVKTDDEGEIRRTCAVSNG